MSSIGPSNPLRALVEGVVLGLIISGTAALILGGGETAVAFSATVGFTAFVVYTLLHVAISCLARE